jgi:hypothetical protein
MDDLLHVLVFSNKQVRHKQVSHKQGNKRVFRGAYIRVGLYSGGGGLIFGMR